MAMEPLTCSVSQIAAWIGAFSFDGPPAIADEAPIGTLGHEGKIGIWMDLTIKPGEEWWRMVNNGEWSIKNRDITPQRTVWMKNDDQPQDVERWDWLS